MKYCPNLLVDMIPVNNAHNGEEERASGGHIADEAFHKMVAECSSNFARGSNFTRLQRKLSHSFLNLERNVGSQIFGRFTLCCFSAVCNCA